jgi:predicted lipopolysaccharide heptosyltransferase III
MYKIINKKKLVATAVADGIGHVLFSWQRLFRTRGAIRSEAIKNILVIRTAYIGDVVMTLPILKPLKELFPSARISFLTAMGAAEVLRSNPFVDEVIAHDPFWFYPSSIRTYREFIQQMRTRTFDLVIEARADIRDILLLAWRFRARYRLSYDVGGGGYLLTHVVPYPGLKHKVEYHLDLVRYLGYRGNGLEWGVYLSNEEQHRVSAIMAEQGIGQPFIAVHPGSRLLLKRWPVQRYGALCDGLMEKYGMPVVVFGAASEKALVAEMASCMKRNPVTLAGALSLREMAGMLARAALFICNDSAPMHLAAAMKTPTVAIFGPSKSVETRPYGEGHRVVEKEFPCRSACDENSCHYERYNACMEDLTVDDVFHAAKELLRSTEKYVQT